LFAELDRLKKEVQKSGVDVISLGIGDPDLPTPAPIVARLQEAARDPANHRYPDYQGLERLRQAATDWYARRFGVAIDPAAQVCALIGSKEGIANFATALVDPGDIVLIPDPGYPVYYAGCVFNGGEPYSMPLSRQNGFLPDFGAIPEAVARRAKLMWLNYPNNPTAATAEPGFFRAAVDYCLGNEIVLAHDCAYSEIAFDGYRAPSLLATPGALECAVEFHSLSKTFSMTGWRVGFAAGNAELVAALGTVKTNVDSGVFQAVQEAAITALGGPDRELRRQCDIYQRRRDRALETLWACGLACDRPKATFYLWVAVPQGFNSAGFARHLLEKCGVVVTPGSGFGRHGEGFIRLSLTVADERLDQALARLKALQLSS
jgi:LL-diaminopimelate aminotransferase